MTIFPTRYSLLSAPALGAHIAQQYHLPGVQCRLLLHGVSDTYLLQDDSDKYIFKIYRGSHRSLEEIKGEIALLDALEANGARVAGVIRDAEGQSIQHLPAAEGTRHGVLFRFAKGKNIYDLTDPLLTSIGREMATIHNITSRITLPYPRETFDLDSMLRSPLQRIAGSFADNQQDYTYLLETTEKVIAKFHSFDMKGFSKGYIHYDYLPKNFHFDEQGNMTVFDFDFAGKGWLAADMGTFLAHFYLHRTPVEETSRAFGVFLDAYQSVRPLAKDEITAIPFFGYTFWIYFLGFQHDNFEDWSNFFWGPRFLKDRVQLIRQYTEMYCRF
jgi:Ser/Thr protein kinase RdoA (MazF antagonist)